MKLSSRWARFYQVYRQTKKALVKAERQPVFVDKLGFRFAAENAQMSVGEFEPEETALVLALLDDADVFLNIGANVGYYCCMALNRGRQCIAVEPIHDNLQLLQKNIVANSWDRGVKVFPVAASDQDGIVKIYGEATGASLVEGWAGSFDARYVPALKLDSMLPHEVPGRLLVLMDIEGHELAALRGATRLLARQPQKPTWVVEVSIDAHWPGGEGLNPVMFETFDLFWTNGYRSFTADAALGEVSRQDLNAIRDTRRNHLRTHNFLFSDKADTVDALRRRIARR
jgi:FkbM family methyltransferase